MFTAVTIVMVIPSYPSPDPGVTMFFRTFRTADFAWSKSDRPRTAFGLGAISFRGRLARHRLRSSLNPATMVCLPRPLYGLPVIQEFLRSIHTSRHFDTDLSSASDSAILRSSRLNNCLTRLIQEKRVSRYPSADKNG